MALWMNSIKHVRKKLHRLYQKIEDEGILPSSFYESRYQNQIKMFTRESDYILYMSPEYRFRNP